MASRMETRPGVARLHPPTDNLAQGEGNMSRGSRNMNTGKAAAATTGISRDLPWFVVVVVDRRLSETVNCLECF